MKNNVITIFLFFVFSLLGLRSYSQYDWSLDKDKDGIKVYESKTKNSNYKSIKVEYTVPGTYDKLMAALNDVADQKDWVYNSKISYELKRNTATDFYYYSETRLPWPLSNRDAVVHMTMQRDSLDRFLKVKAIGVPDYIPEKSGKVRIPKLSINWYVTMLSKKLLNIVYIIDVEPGGSVPTWLANMFVDKGPYESFKKLGDVLKK